MKRKLAVLLALLLSAAAHAQTPFPPQEPPAYTGTYAGILFGRSEAKTGCIGIISGGGRTCDATDTAFGLFGGLQMHRNYGAEIGYVNLGKVRANSNGPATASSQNVSNSLWEAAAVGFLPLHQILPLERGLSAFARVGAYRATLTTSEPGVADHSNFGFAYGAGLQMDFGRKIGLRAQWQRYKNVGGGEYLQQNYDVLGLSALYRFQ
jgi:opacity protein-like surface antigen